MHIAHLARAENELFASRLEDKLRFVFREHVRGAVVLLRQLLLPLHHLAGEANDHVVLIRLSVNGDGPKCGAFDLHGLTLVLVLILPETLNRQAGRTCRACAPQWFSELTMPSPLCSWRAPRQVVSCGRASMTPNAYFGRRWTCTLLGGRRLGHSWRFSAAQAQTRLNSVIGSSP